MNTDLPMPITNENDLEAYENFLKQEFYTVQNTQSLFSSLLKEYIGAALRVDFPTDSRTGILKRVGDDFFVIKPHNRRELLIPLNSVKFVTVLQNNIKPSHF